MRSWITIETQKIISSMQGREMVESMYSDEVELYFGWGGTTGVAVSAGASSFIARSCGGEGGTAVERESG